VRRLSFTVILTLLAAVALMVPAAHAGAAPAQPQSCTQLIRAEEPYLVGGTVEGRIYFHNSAGCEGTWGYYKIQREACGWAGCRWKEITHGSVELHPGETYTIFMGGPCHVGSSRYRTAGTWGGLHYTYSAGVMITC
jgi:hypothetical protein